MMRALCSQHFAEKAGASAAQSNPGAMDAYFGDERIPLPALNLGQVGVRSSVDHYLIHDLIQLLLRTAAIAVAALFL